LTLLPRILFAVAAFALGAVCAVWLDGRADAGGPAVSAGSAVPAAGSGAGAADELEGEVARLRSRLDLEASRHAALEEEVARLAALLDEGQPPGRARDGRPGSAPAPDRSPDALRRARVANDGSFDPARLETAGFDAGVVRDVEQRVADAELARLYLLNQAEREGWLGSARFRNESAEIDEQLRALSDEYGEDLYDWMLFTQGKTNRVVTTNVIAGSPAEQAGLQEGDRVVRYDDQPVFHPRELRQATLEGQAGATVAVEVERGGERVRLIVPRGPLGIRMARATEEPPRPR